MNSARSPGTGAGELVVSELVTNAYRHAPGTDSFELELVRREDGVRIALATRWGAADHHGGNRVWVDLDRPDD